MSGKLERIRQNRFAIIGRAGMDIYPHPPGARTEEATQFFSCLGGSSANIAAAITRLGGQAALITRVSDDAIGRFCLNELDKYGIDRTHVGKTGGQARTSLAIVESRVEDHQSVIYRNDAADFYMDEEDVKKVDYSRYGALVMTGTALAAEPSRAACFTALALAGKAGLPIIFDLDYRPYTWASHEEASLIYSRAARLCDIIVGNDEEFAIMAGGSREKGLAFAKTLIQLGARVVVYKMGEKGSLTFASDGSSFETGIFKVEALKPTGAGDAFMGGFAVSLAAGMPLKSCVERGSAAAAIVVSRVGCAPAMPDLQELEAFMANSGA